ncbi:MAG: hypothetical protein LBH76_06865 [Propionibacteriaceae bacterium]|jgi:Flp pilus assembly pilin Flp|nr:hypothetical protein [Propionibacteriaceae bacterium]
MTLFATLCIWAESNLRAHLSAPLKKKLGDERGATTLEYVIIAAIVCIAAVVLAGIIRGAIVTYQSKIPAGDGLNP